MVQTIGKTETAAFKEVWKIGAFFALLSAVPVYLLETTYPAAICVPIILGTITILILEIRAASTLANRSNSAPSEAPEALDQSELAVENQTLNYSGEFEEYKHLVELVKQYQGGSCHKLEISYYVQTGEFYLKALTAFNIINDQHYAVVAQRHFVYLFHAAPPTAREQLRAMGQQALGDQLMRQIEEEAIGS
jgi:hypothetical protein